MRIIFFLAFFIIFTSDLYAQLLTIKDKTTGKPLAKAQITSKKSTKIIFTDLKGICDISAHKDSEKININLVGYKPVAISYSELEKLGFVMALEENSVTLNEIVVSASHWEQEQRLVPIKISVIKARDIAFKNPLSTADLLNQSGEVYVQKSQFGGGSPMIRGFAANRVLISVDGVRMNNAIFRSGNLQNVISIDPFAVEGSEVIFGPGSVVYGSDAIGGVMDFHTLNPNLSYNENWITSGSAAVRYSSAATEKTAHFDFAIANNVLGFLTSVSYGDYGDLKMGSEGPDDYLRPEYVTQINGIDTVIKNDDETIQKPTGYSQINLMQKIRYKPAEDFDIVYGLYYSTTSNYSRYDRLTARKNGKLRDGDWHYGPQEWIMNNLALTLSDENTLFNQAKLTLAFQNFKESRHNRDFGKDAQHNLTDKVDVLSANLDFEKDLSATSLLFYGAEVLVNSVDSKGEDKSRETGATTKAAPRYPDGSTYNTISAYASYRANLIEELTMQTGLRFNYVTSNVEFDTTFFKFPFGNAEMNLGAVNGSLGFAYNPSEDLRFMLNLSTGFRAPNIDDLGKVFESAPGLVVVPNPDLKPEYAYNIDFGAAKVFGDFLKLDISMFYNYLTDAMVRRNFQFNGLDSIMYQDKLSQVQAIQNAANAQVWGVQAGFELSLPKGFSLSSRFNWQKGEEELDNGSTAPLRHAAPMFGIFSLGYKVNGLKAELYSEYNGEIKNADLAPSEKDKAYMYALDDDGNPYQPSWFTLNLKATYNILDYLQLSAGIENILDKRYRYYSSGISAPGRNVILALRTYF